VLADGMPGDDSTSINISEFLPLCCTGGNSLTATKQKKKKKKKIMQLNVYSKTANSYCLKKKL
jgi:hypothetical protein